MFTLFLTIEPYIQSTRPRSRVILCPRLIERLNAALVLGPVLVGHDQGRTRATSTGSSLALLQAQLATTLPSMVNVVEQAGLAATVKIEVYKTISSEVADSPGVKAHVVQRLTIADSLLGSRVL